MAEYKEVIHNIKRICERRKNQCDTCMLGLEACPNNARFDTTDEKEFDRLEKIVMEWAKNNPEPTYPSYLEVFGWAHTISWSEIKEIITKPIPEDIVQKLGIKPKGE